jgi:hypothetical protein
MAEEEDSEATDEADDADASAGEDDDGPSSTADEAEGSDATAGDDAGDDQTADPDYPTPQDALRFRAIVRHSGRWWTRRRRQRVAVVAGIVALVLAWQVASSGDGRLREAVPGLTAAGGRSPAQTVTGFFQAQAAGDCERLVDDLLTEESWSDGGRLRRGQFLDRCADAVEGYRPNVRDVQIQLVDEEGDVTSDDDGVDRAVVGIGVPPGLDIAYEDDVATGRLVREDGEWKVRTDPVVLHLGRTVEETVAAYVEAYDTGDCDTIADVLSEEVWSQDGELDRDQFLAECGRAADRRQERMQPAIGLRTSEVSIDDHRQATATITHGDPLGSRPRILYDEDDEAATLVREDFLLRSSPRAGLRAVGRPGERVELARCAGPRSRGTCRPVP